MIKLKNEVNKAKLIREARESASSMYKNAYMPKLRINEFVYGVEYALKKLQK